MKTGTRPPAFATSSPRRPAPRHSGPARRPARLLSQRRRGGPGRTGRPLLQRALRWAHGRSARRASPPPLGRRRRDRSDGAARRPWRSSRARRSREPRGTPEPRRARRARRPRPARGALGGDVPPQVLGHAPALDPHRRLVADDPALARLPGVGWSGCVALDPRRVRHARLRLRRLGVRQRRGRRASRSPARHDDAHRAGHHGRASCSASR